MTRQSVRYGLDRCPATKNYSHMVFCRHCDFRAGEGKDCCECQYVKFLGKENKKRQKELPH